MNRRHTLKHTVLWNIQYIIYFIYFLLARRNVTSTTCIMHCFILILREEDYAGDIRKFFKKINMIFGAAWLHIDYAAKNVMLQKWYTAYGNNRKCYALNWSDAAQVWYNAAKSKRIFCSINCSHVTLQRNLHHGIDTVACNPTFIALVYP